MLYGNKTKLCIKNQETAKKEVIRWKAKVKKYYYVKSV